MTKVVLGILTVSQEINSAEKENIYLSLYLNTVTRVIDSNYFEILAHPSVITGELY